MQFIKERKFYIITSLISLAVICLGCYVITIQATDRPLRDQLQSAENKVQRLIDEKTQLTNSFTEQLQSSESTNQKLLDAKKELQNEIDQNNAELQSVRSENKRLLEDKNRLLEKIDQIKDDREVYSTQLQYIEKWIDCIDKLQEHIHALVHCSESKRKESSYADPKLCSRISYDFDESFAGEIILRTADLIMKYKFECREFLDALLLKKIDIMKKQQADYDMKKLGKRWKNYLKKLEMVNIKRGKKKRLFLKINKAKKQQ